MRSITVDQCMTRSVITLPPEQDVVEAMHILLKHNITAAPVVDEGGAILGLLSETDCLAGTLEGSYYSQGSGLVSEYMHSNIITAHMGDSIIDVYEQCMQKGALRVPVLGTDGRLAGMLSPKDMMLAVLEYYEKPVTATG